MSASLRPNDESVRVRTRASLLARLKDLEDSESWRDFFETYWALLYRFAVAKGLSESEAEDVVQETVIVVARKIKDFEYEPKWFSIFAVADIKDLSSLATKLHQESDAVSAFLRSQLSSITLQALTTYQAPLSNPEPIRAALVQELNKIIKTHALYNAQRFAGVALRPATRQLQAQNPQGEDLARLNRLLLEDAYPLELSRKGRFSTWLCAIANYRILKSQSRRRSLSQAEGPDTEDGDGIPLLYQIPDPASLEQDALWQREWELNALAVATDRAKQKANAEDFQRYDYHVIQGHSSEDTARHLDCEVNTVYSAKHRLLKLIKKEVERLRQDAY